MPRATDIVVTTIFEPAWLGGYLENIRAHGRMDEVTLRIICDRKTPASVFAAAAEAQRAGYKVDCPSLEEQATYLGKIGVSGDFIPWNSDNRRNIGFLRAWEHGAQVLVSIDDDNHCRTDFDFVGDHGVVGSKLGALHGIRYAGGEPWFNICSLLTLDVQAVVFPRGFPYAARQRPGSVVPGPVPPAASGQRVAINAGLWLDDPDVDALTRLTLRPRASAASSAAVALAPETWSPINSQNTALLRDAIPSYYYVRMGFPVQGMRIGRFGDILSGYFAQKCAKHLGHAVRIGSPVADHRRTPHNLFEDLHHELAGVVLTEELVPWLQELKLSGSDYAGAYSALAEALTAAAATFRGFVWDQGGRDFLRETADCMRHWLAALQRLG